MGTGFRRAATLGAQLPAWAQGKKILVIASNQDIPNFDPHVATGYSASMLLRNTYDALVRVEGAPTPKVCLRLMWPIIAPRNTGTPSGKK